MAELYHDVTGNDLIIDIASMNSLYETAKWGRILAIAGFAFVGLTVLFAVLMQQYMGQIYANAGINNLGLSIFTTGFYVVFAIIYFFPSLYLLHFSNKMMAGLKIKDQELINASFKNLRILFKYMGVLFLITLVLYGLTVLLMALGTSLNSGVN